VKSVMDSMSMGGGGGGSGYGGSSFEASMGSMAKGEISAKTTYQKSAKGPVAISECPPDGKFVQIENTGTKEENLVGWKVTRKVDDKEITPFELDSRFAAVRPRQKISLYAKGQKPRSAAPQDIEIGIDSWGIGATAYTRLINKEGEERASNIQRTSYSS
jgi:intermediate filament protein if